MCIEHIINPVRHRVRLIKRLKIEGSVKPNSRTRCMKSGVNGGVRSVNVDQPVARSKTEVPRLTTYSGVSDDTINIHPG
jgi:hypothetical protein